jgi:choline kinase
MRVAILGAGVGRRLDEGGIPPKVLLRFGGESLLARHAAILRYFGVTRIDLVVGYRADEVAAEIARIGARDLFATHLNPDYEEGAIVSLWALREVFKAGDPVIFMDGDVLYDHRMMAQLMDSPRDNCFLMDRIVGEGEDPVRLCMRDGVLVDIHKRPGRAFDWWGEWIGFCRFSPAIAAKVAEAAGAYVGAGRRDLIYEQAFQDVVHAEPPGTFGVEDVTGLPWVEIDFPEDLQAAKTEIFPRLLPLPGADEGAKTRAAGGS